MSELVEKTKKLAIKAHEGQFYGTGDPYFYHLEQVAKMAEKLGYDERVVAACYLHDIAEDTEVTMDDLRIEFPDEVVSAVEAVTFTDDGYEGKIEKAIGDKIGHVVKFCDASCNYANAIIYKPPKGKRYDEVVFRRSKYLEQLRKNLPMPSDLS